MNNKNNLILVLAGILVLIGITKPDLSGVLSKPNRPSVVEVEELAAPVSEQTRERASKVAEVFKNSDSATRKADAKKLRDLYVDIATAIGLDGTDEVIKDTKEITQINEISGVMLRLGAKGKYPDLVKLCNAVVVGEIGDDEILLDKELRQKAVNAFMALAWACDTGSK